MSITSHGHGPFLTFARFRFHLQCTTPTILPPYKGSVFRGAFGKVLRQVVCSVRKTDCAECTLRPRCLYVAIFEPSPPPDFLHAGKFQQAPRPYVLNPPLLDQTGFRPGDILIFELTLFGRALEALPYFLYVFTELGRQGLGKVRGKYDLVKVEASQDGRQVQIFAGHTFEADFSPESGPQFLPGDTNVSSLSLRFLTPLRFKIKGDLSTRLTFLLFFERLAHRLALLATFHGSPENLPDFTSLISEARSIQIVSHNLRWHDWERYSRRQDTVMKLGGLVGRLALKGPLGPFLPYLRLGAQVNVGQETTFGLGRFRLEFPGEKG